MKVPEIFQVETPQARVITDAMLVTAARAIAEAAPAGQLLPDPLDLTVHERVSRAVRTAITGAAPGSVLAANPPAQGPPQASGPQSEAP